MGIIALVITLWQIWPTSKPNLDGEWKLMATVVKIIYFKIGCAVGHKDPDILVIYNFDPNLDFSL